MVGIDGLSLAGMSCFAQGIFVTAKPETEPGDLSDIYLICICIEIEDIDDFDSRHVHCGHELLCSPPQRIGDPRHVCHCETRKSGDLRGNIYIIRLCIGMQDILTRATSLAGMSCLAALHNVSVIQGMFVTVKTGNRKSTLSDIYILDSRAG